MNRRLTGPVLLVASVGLLACGDDDAAAAPSAKAPRTSTPTPPKQLPEEVADVPEEADPGADDRAAIAAARKTYAKNLAKGRKLTRAGDHAEAIALYREALGADPNDVTVLGELGWAAFLSGQLDLAERTTRHALRHATTGKREGMLLYNLGRVAEAREQRDAAIGFYRQSLRKRPGNATVKQHLDALEPAVTPKEAAKGMPVLARGIREWSQVCATIKEAACAEYQVLDGDEACVCEDDTAPPPSPGDPQTLPGALVRLDVGETVTHQVWFPVLKDREGWTIFDSGIWSYNPGAFGIFEELEATERSFVQLIPGKSPEWVVRFAKSRVDRDMGLHELETESFGWTFACAVVGGRSYCTLPIEERYHFLREVETWGEPDDLEHDPELPIKASYGAKVRYLQDGTVSVRVTTDEDEVNRRSPQRLPTGTHPLVRLLGVKKPN